MTAAGPLTLADLRRLCDRYVPLTSRHPGSLDRDDHWWHAHELGHLLTVDSRDIGQPLFGLEWSEASATDPRREHELRCRELAAMSVSRRLLIAAGRADLVRAEIDSTDGATLRYADRGRVRRILRKHRCLRLPSTRAELERKLQWVTAAARRGAA